MRYRYLIAGGLVLAMIALCGGMVLSVTNIGAMVSRPGIGNMSWLRFNNNRYSAEATDEKRFAVNAPAKLNVENTAGKVTVTGGSGKEIVIAIRKKGFGATQADADAALAALTIDTTQNGDAVTVKVIPQNPANQVDFTITVPEETAITTSNLFGDTTLSNIKGDIDLKTNAGSVRVSDAQGKIKLQSDFGEIRLERATADTLDIDSNAGNIKLKQVTVKETVTANTEFGNVSLDQAIAKTYDLKTNAGKIEVSGASGSLKAATDFGGIEVTGGEKVQLNLKSNSGSIRYSGSLGEGPHTVRTDFGSITLILPKDSALDVSLKTDFGSIKSDLPISLSGTQSRTSWVGTTNGGGASLTAKTNNGTIAIEILK
jgi:DUF4097 and DUF4098 domain-containing protein YvlB